MNEERLEWVTGRFADPDMTPTQFEHFVADLIRAVEPRVDSLSVAEHEVISASDGNYDFDTTIRFNLLGADFLVLVESKMHKNPIKRDLVQTLHAKLLSVGAHKAIMVSSSRYQGGAVAYARAHGISLVKVTEGRFTFEVRSKHQPPPLTREQAAELGAPTYVAHHYYGIEGGLGVTMVSPEHPDYILKLFGIGDGADEPR